MVRVDSAFWQGRRVLLTGHTGFKGAWMCFWLARMGAEVVGFSNGRPTQPCLFDVAGLKSDCQSIWGDLRDLTCLREAVAQTRPDIVIHLAAQALVIDSYLEPVETFATNLMGTVNLLEAIRVSNNRPLTLVVTSDKCYAPPPPPDGYPEAAAMGGHDPYSASKACAELAVHSFRQSYGEGWPLATARAGNVIGGGDWARNRLLPDLVRGIVNSSPVRIRSPLATRPWQHVLDSIHGYLALLEKLSALPDSFSCGWNFGPPAHLVRSVKDLVDQVESAWEPCAELQPQDDGFPEAPLLQLNSEKAKVQLEWRPLLDFETAVNWSVNWYRDFYAGSEARTLLNTDLENYLRCSS